MPAHFMRTQRKLQSMIGRKFGRLTVTSLGRRIPCAKGYRYAWACVCDCGTQRVVLEPNLKAGRTQSCGCQNAENVAKPRTHGRSGTKEYRAWSHIKGRCYCPTVEKYQRYGGRGIKVCDRWRDSFACFLADMGPAPTPKHEVDRIDNDGDYESGNCRWATRLEQMRNTSSNHILTFRGEDRPVCEWAEIVRIPSGLISERINDLGWSVEEALTIKPVKGFKRSRLVARRGVQNEAPLQGASVPHQKA